jgi:hypothetical protein
VRRLLVSLVLVSAFGLFLLLPEERRGPWLVYEEELPLPSVDARPAEPERERGAPEAAAPRQTFAGRVLRPDGSGVPGVAVRLEHAWVPEVRAISDAEGRFELTPEEPRGELALAGSDWLLLGGDRILSPTRSEGYVLAVAPPLTVSGSVVDPLGEPIAAADVRALTPPDVLVPLGIASLPLPSEGHAALSDPEGRFQLGPLPDVPGVEIEVAADGMGTKRVPLEGATELRIELAPRTE